MVIQSSPKLEITGIKITRGTKSELDEVKIIPEEPYDKVVRRLLSFFKEHQDKDQGGH